MQVVPGMLSVRQVTGLLQQYNAEAPSQDGVLQYPHLLEMLCRCAVLLRQQVQRKLSGPWVNITEVVTQFFWCISLCLSLHICQPLMYYSIIVSECVMRCTLATCTNGDCLYAGEIPMSLYLNNPS